MNLRSLAKNPVKVYKRLFRNISFNLAESRNCSPLIDVLFAGYYNVHMEENTVQAFIATETARPPNRLNRSIGALYIILMALILAVISAANLLDTRWQIPRYLVQPFFYVLIAIVSVYIYRRHYVCFRYTLTDQTLLIERLAGGSERMVAAVLLTDIMAIETSEREKRFFQHAINASILSRKDSTLLHVGRGTGEVMIWISPSEIFLRQLKTQRQVSAL